ncbi:Glycosyl transferase family 2 [Anaerovirgula multivorans]|uniref:Glycosyl transferase family 2 n=1 Tax=Anaerovirgula multivorans TaxID=312168 RepID=A0A239EWV4_9FIRM|nr:glycosyltransferase [Anaerovirgula multivorans]SNS49095.1 Glycosyl transferase family 2 [Anaerovirgula multivorans]
MKLSIVMMVKNESKYLEKCLKSLDPIREAISSELIIVDTGSQDNTMEIAKRYTKKVYFHLWKDNFAEMRNITIGYAKGEWLFVIDGDEIVEDAKDIIQFFKHNFDKRYNTALVSIKNFTSDKREYNTVVHVCRLFKNKKFLYTGSIHEQPIIRHPIYFLDVILLHFGYISTDKELMKRKFVRNIALLEKELEREPDNSYTWFQLSQSYGMYNKHKESLEAALKAYEIAKEKKYNMNERMYIYIQIAHCYYVAKKYKKLEEICQEAIVISNKNLDLYWFLAYAQQNLTKIDDAIKNYEKYLEIRKDFNKYKDPTSIVFTLDSHEGVYYELSKLLTAKENYKQAIEYGKMIQSNHVLKLALESIIAAYLKTGNHQKLLDFYHERCKGDKILKESFYDMVELKIQSLKEEEKFSLIQLFSKLDDSYGFLNSIRLLAIRDEMEIECYTLEKIKTFHYDDLPPYYSDMIYFMMKKGIPIIDILYNLRETKRYSFLNYLANTYKSEFFDIILQSMKKHFLYMSQETSKIEKIVCGALLSYGEMEDKEYLGVFKRYIHYGVYDLEETYHRDIIQQESINRVKTDEDVFFLLMLKAYEFKDTEQANYIRYLRKALKVYPMQKKGIELMMQDEKKKADKTSEFEHYRNKVKEQINSLIGNGRLENAAKLLDEYADIAKDDISIYALRSMIAIVKENWEDAEEILKEGLLLEPTDFDLLCNAAYLCETKNQIQLAINLYQQALLSTNNAQHQQQISAIIEELSGNCAEGDDIVSQNDKKNIDEVKEFAEYTKQVKSKIEEFINNGELDHAKLILKEYETIVQDDLEALFYKSQIAVMENVSK